MLRPCPPHLLMIPQSPKLCQHQHHIYLFVSAPIGEFYGEADCIRGCLPDTIQTRPHPAPVRCSERPQIPRCSEKHTDKPANQQTLQNLCVQRAHGGVGSVMGSVQGGTRVKCRVHGRLGQRGGREQKIQATDDAQQAPQELFWVQQWRIFEYALLVATICGREQQ